MYFDTLLRIIKNTPKKIKEGRKTPAEERETYITPAETALIQTTCTSTEMLEERHIADINQTRTEEREEADEDAKSRAKNYAMHKRPDPYKSRPGESD